MVILVL